MDGDVWTTDDLNFGGSMQRTGRLHWFYWPPLIHLAICLIALLGYIVPSLQFLGILWSLLTIADMPCVDGDDGIGFFATRCARWSVGNRGGNAVVVRVVSGGCFSCDKDEGCELFAALGQIAFNVAKIRRLDYQILAPAPKRHCGLPSGSARRCWP